MARDGRIAFKLLKLHVRPDTTAPLNDAAKLDQKTKASRKALTFAEVMARHSGTRPRPEPRQHLHETHEPLPEGCDDERHAISLNVELGSRMADAHMLQRSLCDSGEAREADAQDDDASSEAGVAPEPETVAQDDPKAIRHSADTAKRLHGNLAVTRKDNDSAPQGKGNGEAVAGAAPVPVAALDHELDIVRYLADTAARFCSDPAVAKGEGWQVQIELDPEILRETTLHLSLSPHWLTLRFVSEDQRAQALVLEHQEALEQTLADILEPRREIAITVE